MTRRVPDRDLPLSVACVLLVSGLAGFTQPAHAQEAGAETAREPLDLSWEAPAECLDARAIRDEVRRLLGGVMPELEEAVAARGVTTLQETGAYRLTLSTSVADVEGERVLEDEACDDLGRAAALILALMIDPEAVANTQPEAEAAQGPEASLEPGTGPDPGSEPEPATRPVAHALATPRADPPETAAAVPPNPLFGFVGIGGALDLGTVPDASGAILLEGGFGVALVDARLRATLVFGRPAAHPDDPASGANITAFSFDARACFHPFEDARFVHGCAGLLVGFAVAEGFGFDLDRTGVGTFVAGEAGLGLAWRAESWFDLSVDAELLVPFNPLEFVVGGATDAFHRQSPIAGRFGVTAHAFF